MCSLFIYLPMIIEDFFSIFSAVSNNARTTRGPILTWDLWLLLCALKSKNQKYPLICFLTILIQNKYNINNCVKNESVYKHSTNDFKQTAVRKNNFIQKKLLDLTCQKNEIISV
ncbi:hypothetical protein BpHYR1_016639 [Brachionus plicatilis]|uniref:Uncharacterized protein n=1 Tax=Brachionus plicatilis TaxID=10195 RepID=A0A3M7Q535_BRAPC|nr:hypothetical protein BpHYR1_016639 [Brachionus plicatilis]